MARVLCVDDQHVFLRANTILFRREGHEVWITESGADAPSLIKTGVVDILVQDIMRPGMDGLRLLRALRADPALADLPVVIVSESPPDPRLRIDDRETGLSLPVEAWLATPWTGSVLVNAVAVALAERGS